MPAATSRRLLAILALTLTTAACKPACALRVATLTKPAPLRAAASPAMRAAPANPESPPITKTWPK